MDRKSHHLEPVIREYEALPIRIRQTLAIGISQFLAKNPQLPPDTYGRVAVRAEFLLR